MKTSIQNPKRDRTLLERRRMKAADLFAKGKTQYAVAKKFGISTAATNQWYASWKDNGTNGLKSKGHPGFQSKYTEEKKKELKKIILSSPQKYGYRTNFWTVDRLRSVAKKKLKISLGLKQTWTTILGLGFSVQKPIRRAKERNEKAIAQWKLKTFPKLKKMGKET